MDKKDLLKLPLEEKESLSRKLIHESAEKFNNNIGILFSGDRDSTMLLHCVMTVFDGRIPWKVFKTETGVEFPEVKEFTAEISGKWGFELITLRNDEALKTIEIAKDKTECCRLLKEVPLNKAVVDYSLSAMMNSERWNEREPEPNKDFFTANESPAFTIVQPILHFKELDIWAYIKKYNIPYCNLYKKGIRTIDCKPCTKSPGFNRSGRSEGTGDKTEVMSRLKSLGYL